MKSVRPGDHGRNRTSNFEGGCKRSVNFMPKFTIVL